jgi:hypothetical protein
MLGCLRRAEVSRVRVGGQGQGCSVDSTTAEIIPRRQTPLQLRRVDVWIVLSLLACVEADELHCLKHR